MWRDSTRERLERYRRIIEQDPGLYPSPGANRKMQRSEENETFRGVSDYVLAPALNAYVLWVLQQALVSGKKRLYFLARDGYLMYQTAQVYCRKLRLPIECRYLYCSRYSVRIPMFHLNMAEAMDYICRGGIDVTLQKIFERAGLGKTEQKEVLRYFPASGNADEIIPYARLSEIRDILETCEPFREAVIRHSREAMPGLTGYFYQEGLLDDVPCALVDSGWVGSMQKVISQVLTYMRNQKPPASGTACDCRLEGYYWGLYELPDGVKASDYHCYYFSPGENLREKVYFSNCLFEGIFSAPHGMTLGYMQEGGCYRPILDEVSPEKQKFMEAVEKRILQYAEEKAETMLPENLRHMDPGQNQRTVYQLLKLFMGEPTRQEAELFGSLQFSDDVLEHGGQQMAAPLSAQELRDNHVGHKILRMLGIQKGAVRESAWYEGSAVRSGRGAGRHLRSYAGYKYLLYLRKKRIWSKRKDG